MIRIKFHDVDRRLLDKNKEKLINVVTKFYIGISVSLTFRYIKMF